MKIYVITSGDYSDYHIDAVFADYEKAKKQCALWNEKEYHEIEEYEISDNDDIEVKEEDICYKHSVFFSKSGKHTICEPVLSIKHKSGFNYKNKNYCLFDVYLKEPDKDKALKIASDMFAKWKAEQIGL